ncbi:MAG: phosphate/phosphite/phosphonate ABC transporter substrate-binding protein [Nitrospirae bacterium]|nr:phosphate/phosphite/phosphonate ABC transporter substrate-binding protein [Nitrospirota bacterium]
MRGTKRFKTASILLILLILLIIPFESMEAEGPLRIAITPVLPEGHLEPNREMINYIGDRIERSAELVQRRSYQEINDLLQKGEVDVAFVGGVTYILGRDKSAMELLVAPVVFDESTNYFSYLVVRKDSPIRSLLDLKGKRFAFTDPLSTSGKLLPAYLLARINETPETFFKKYIYTYSHSSSIEAVSVGLVDGASVDSYIWDFLSSKDPESVSRLKIIERHELIGTTPVVVRNDIEPGLKERLRRVFLDMERDQRGREILNKMGIKRFVDVKDSIYNATREMFKFVERRTDPGRKKKR